MKMTVDLPEELIRKMKLRAVHDRKKLKEVAEDAIRAGLSARLSSPQRGELRRIKLPLVRMPKGGKKFKLDSERIAELEMDDERERNQIPLRH